MKFSDGPIITCSSGGHTKTAIAILRLSGFDNILDLQPFFEISLTKIKARYAHFTKILGIDGRALDEILLLYFEGPKSYNGENILELHVHGNPLNIQRIQNLFITHAGFRLATGGEFTFRALKNQKLDFSQVEGLDLLLNADSPLAFDQGLDLLNGELNQAYQGLYEHYLDMRTSIELAIDFSDDIGLEEIQKRYLGSLNSFLALAIGLAKKASASNSALLNPEVVLFGPTNAGKSTLFNKLFGSKRSIVSKEAGTTRDYISETIAIHDCVFRLVDTAGVRSTKSEIESEGIEASLQLLGTSFFKILVFNPSAGAELFQDFQKRGPFDLVIFTHRDQLEEGAVESLVGLMPASQPFVFTSLLEGFGPIEPLEFGGPIEPAELAGPIEPVELLGPIEPAELRGPIEPLISQAIYAKYLKSKANLPLLLERHRVSVRALKAYIDENDSALSNFNDLAILSSLVDGIGAQVKDLIGVIPAEKILNHLFSRFCIGK